jgi:hypothetical protein
MAQGSVNLCFFLEIAFVRHSDNMHVMVAGRPFAMTFSPLKKQNTGFLVNESEHYLDRNDNCTLKRKNRERPGFILNQWCEPLYIYSKRRTTECRVSL